MVLQYKTFEILNVSEPTNKFLQLHDCTLNFYFLMMMMMMMMMIMMMMMMNYFCGMVDRR